jgi:hypothetical protein
MKKKSTLALALLFMGFAGLNAGAQDGVLMDEFGTAPEEKQEDKEEFKATEIGVRFTPQMARAMSRKFSEQMKTRYELDEQQSDGIQQLMTKQFMKFAEQNGRTGRDMIELMMATMIENDGRFPKEEAIAFAKLSKPLTTNLKTFFTESAGEIGKKMSLTQRLKFTGDVTLAATGLTVFESRMNRWAEGKIGDNANPFFDPADKDPAASQPTQEDPKEDKEYRRARKDVERWIEFQINPDERWEEYMKQAIKFYNLNEKQVTAANAILKDSVDRAKAIKTPEWKNKIKENRIAQRLTMQTASELGQGSPWMFALEENYQSLMRPLDDLAKEFKRRLDAIPDSTQRAKAIESIRRKMMDKGVKQLPL